MSAQIANPVPCAVRQQARNARDSAMQAHSDVMDRIRKPTLVIGLDRRIYTANRAANDMLLTALSPLRTALGYLHGTDNGVDNAIALQAFSVAQWPTLSITDQYAPVAEPMRACWVAVSVSCLYTPARQNAEPYATCLLLTVHPVVTRAQVDPALLQAALGLSRAEARVSTLIYGGLSLREAAEVMEIGQSTAKTHLQGVFSKTQINKQTELVRLVASLA